jgi:hypothetical protein
MRHVKSVLSAIAAVAAMSLGGAAHAALIQSATTTLGGTAIDFEGFAEGQLISNQYAGSGVTFSQVDGFTPMIDNSPFLWAYNASSGTGVLVGSKNDPAQGGAPFQAVAGLKATLVTAGSALEFWLGDDAPLGVYTISAFDSSNALLESFVVTPNSFVGFSGLTNLKWASVDSDVVNDAFAIDDVRITSGQAVPEPVSLGLVGLGLVALGWSRRRRG